MKRFLLVKVKVKVKVRVSVGASVSVSVVVGVLFPWRMKRFLLVKVKVKVKVKVSVGASVTALRLQTRAVATAMQMTTTVPPPSPAQYFVRLFMLWVAKNTRSTHIPILRDLRFSSAGRGSYSKCALLQYSWSSTSTSVSNESGSPTLSGLAGFSTTAP